jgi:hypothetical protein
MNNVKTAPMTEEALEQVRIWCRMLKRVLSERGIQTWLVMDKQLWVMTIRVGKGGRPQYQLKAYAPAIAKWDRDECLKQIDWYVTEFESYFRYRKGK